MAVGVAGTVTAAVGLALVPLPGPGWPVVLFGLYLLSTEFAWAHALLRKVTLRLETARSFAARAPRPVRVGIAVALVVLGLGPAALLLG